MLGKDDKKKRASSPAVVEDDAQLAPLRQFCRLRGIELPYRATWEHGRRAAGFAAAVERAVANGRPDVVVLISDLAGLAEDEARAKPRDRAPAQGGRQVIALVPSPAAFLPPATTPHGRRVRELMVRDQRAMLEPGRRLLMKHGITVLEGSPAVPLEQLLHGRRRRRCLNQYVRGPDRPVRGPTAGPRPSARARGSRRPSRPTDAGSCGPAPSSSPSRSRAPS